MTLGSRGSLGSSAVDLDFCVVATGLTNHTRSHEPPAFPDVRRNLHSSARAPLFHRHTQSSEQAGEGPPVPTTIAPFAGQMCSSSTDLDSPDKAGGNSGDVGSSNGRSATSDFTADGHSLNSDSSKTAGRNPGTASTKHRGPWGRERSTSAPMPPQPVDDPEKAPPKTVSATYSSSVENQAKSPARDAGEVRRATGLEAVSEDVLVQICDYIQERDIVRLSTVSANLFDESLWEQLHLVRFGGPSIACLKGLPFARASRLQLQSDFPIHHARLLAIRYQHGRICSMLAPEGTCSCCPCPRMMFAAEALTREDRSLREEERAIRLERADCRRKQHTTRASLLRDMAVAKRASTNESMAMVGMRSAVERHSYAPGCRPRAPQEPSAWREGPRGRRGKAKGILRIVPPSLSGVFDEA